MLKIKPVKSLLFMIIFLLIVNNYSLLSFISFDESMETTSPMYLNKYNSEEMKININFLKNLYEQNHPSKIIKEEQKIPRIIHQIWVGPKPIPDFYKKIQKSWINFHPEWEYKLWTDKEVSKLTLYNYSLYNRTKDLREKADLLRYELLFQFGGLYVDMDFECLKKFDELLYYDFFVGIVGNEHAPIVNNALIGATKGNAILKSIIENIKDEDVENWFMRSGVFYFSNECLKGLIVSDNNNIAFPISYFYSVPYIYDKDDCSEYIKPETMALHYWGNKKGFNK